MKKQRSFSWTQVMPFALFQLLCLLFIATDWVESAWSEDKQVLIELKHFLQARDRVNHGVYESWSELDSSPCGWRGVGCDAAGQVGSLDLSGSSISGTAFGNFSRLPALTRLDLSNNSIEGALPAGDIGRCRRLVHLDLSRNLIGGHLDVSGLARLQTLDVSENRFTSISLPAACKGLTVLNVSSNSLSCDLAEWLKNCTKLEHVDVSSNSLTGHVWPHMASLKQFNAAENNLTGIILNNFFPNGCKLESLDLSFNKLHGSLPGSVANCRDLVLLSLWGNNFGGLIPAGIGKITGLETLILGSNLFDRRIPLELTNCTNLRYLDISENFFGKEVQSIFGNFTGLRHLVLHDNVYTGGIISSGILRLPLLARLDLSFNEFHGELAEDVAHMKSLRYLILNNNFFSGTIPPRWGQLTDLQLLGLSYNKLSGRIPSSIGNLTSLIGLMIPGNHLSSEIPPEIGNCTSLIYLNLQGNSLSGNVPPEMMRMGSDPWVTFDKNRKDSSVLVGFGQCITLSWYMQTSYSLFNYLHSVMNWQTCRMLWDSILKGYGVIPICDKSSLSTSYMIPKYVILSQNMLSGAIPTEIVSMKNLSMLYLDDNALSGHLPPELGNLPLIVLNVSRNYFSGPIPPNTGQASCLEVLDLSYNNLSGELPSSLGQLSRLSLFNASYNPLLSGKVPTEGQFGTFDGRSFLGDPQISFQQSNGKHSWDSEIPSSQGSGTNSKTIEPWILFSISVALLTGSATFFIINLKFDSVKKFIPYGYYI
ncbi:unnamed protein product [Urochloa humidicola]